MGCWRSSWRRRTRRCEYSQDFCLCLTTKLPNPHVHKDFDAVLISVLLKRCKGSLEVDLAENAIGIMGFNALANSLGHLPNLKFLDVQGNAQMKRTTLSQMLEALEKSKLANARVNLFGYDLVIRNGIIFDGLRTPRFVSDIGIKNGKTATIGRVSKDAVAPRPCYRDPKGSKKVEEESRAIRL